MFLKVILQKESPNQSRPKVSKSPKVHSQMFFKIGFLEISQYLQENICIGVLLIKLQTYFNTYFLVNIAKSFDNKSPVASVDLLFLIKSNVRWFLLQRLDLAIAHVI